MSITREAKNRMDGLVSEGILAQAIDTLQEAAEQLADDGFENNEIAEFLAERIREAFRAS
jgi:hypothetical protein